MCKLGDEEEKCVLKKYSLANLHDKKGFEKEAKIMHRLNHPNVVSILSVIQPVDAVRDQPRANVDRFVFRPVVDSESLIRLQKCCVRLFVTRLAF